MSDPLEPPGHSLRTSGRHIRALQYFQASLLSFTSCRSAERAGRAQVAKSTLPSQRSGLPLHIVFGQLIAELGRLLLRCTRFHLPKMMFCFLSCVFVMFLFKR